MSEYVKFTEEMKKTHTILVPDMLPIHFRMLCKIYNAEGFKLELLQNDSRAVVDEGLKNVHNDACYPALLVIGQFMDALNSGKYDINKTALLITQTGGGCRASNYIHLLRKALDKKYPQVPVVSLNFSGLEKDSAFKVTGGIFIKLLHAVLYGDLLMTCYNKCRAYEVNKGDSKKMLDKWENRLGNIFRKKEKKYLRTKKIYRDILNDFASIELSSEKKIKVGIVGEIYVKFSPLGNNNLESFLLSENVEPIVPGFVDFCLYCVYNGIADWQLYRVRGLKAFGSKFLYRYLLKKQRDIRRMMQEDYPAFMPMADFDETRKKTKGYIGIGAKMGEGWLLTAEMLELIGEGVTNIICTQPFGCLPNHIAGKGMMKPIKEKNPGVNIVAIDYDPGATAINQENRIKLMLSNAKRNRE